MIAGCRRQRVVADVEIEHLPSQQGALSDPFARSKWLSRTFDGGW